MPINSRPPRRTNQEVIEAFCNQQVSNAGALVSDGQSLYSYNLRIAEFIPLNGRRTIVVYDYTSGGGSFVSQTTSNHVGLVKRRVPRSNVIKIDAATRAGLIV
jgi:hypothetical protein